LFLIEIFSLYGGSDDSYEESPPEARDTQAGGSGVPNVIPLFYDAQCDACGARFGVYGLELNSGSNRFSVLVRITNTGQRGVLDFADSVSSSSAYGISIAQADAVEIDLRRSERYLMSSFAGPSGRPSTPPKLEKDQTWYGLLVFEGSVTANLAGLILNIEGFGGTQRNGSWLSRTRDQPFIALRTVKGLRYSEVCSACGASFDVHKLELLPVMDVFSVELSITNTGERGPLDMSDGATGSVAFPLTKKQADQFASDFPRAHAEGSVPTLLSRVRGGSRSHPGKLANFSALPKLAVGESWRGWLVFNGRLPADATVLILQVRPINSPGRVGTWLSYSEEQPFIRIEPSWTVTP
jgi:hypothetical protein